MNAEEIKRAYLKAIGNPESGILAELADQIAQAILEIEEEENPKEAKAFNPVKEQRVISPTETR
jgi:hypothetical protein